MGKVLRLESKSQTKEDWIPHVMELAEQESLTERERSFLLRVLGEIKKLISNLQITKAEILQLYNNTKNKRNDFVTQTYKNKIFTLSEQIKLDYNVKRMKFLYQHLGNQHTINEDFNYGKVVYFWMLAASLAIDFALQNV